jgi:uncharacterized protein (TIGR03118 family)
MQVFRTPVIARLGVVFFTISSLAHAQFKVTNLDSNQLNQAPIIDPLLGNAWGLARSATSPWWISDNSTGWSTLYDGNGTIVPLKVVIPTAGNGPTLAAGLNGPGSPTGVVFNGTSQFLVDGVKSNFIFATLDGTISAWPGTNKNLATLVVDNSATEASYTGLAITNNAAGNFLFAADNTNNKIDMFDGSFNLVKSFGDPSIPSNFSVFGLQDIDGLLYVTYAIPNTGAGGFVDLFTESGIFVKTLLQGAPLNQPWGIAAAPRNFGKLSNTLLISNNLPNGTINAFDPITGTFVGTIKDENGKKITFNNLWGIEFGGGNTTNGAANTLFVASGPDSTAGTFSSISPVK